MRSFRALAAGSLILLGGCALRAKNVKPEVPYDFALLHQMALYSQAVYQNELAIKTLCKPFYPEVYVGLMPATNNQYFLATSTTTHTQVLAIAGTANIENVLLDADFTHTYVPELNISLHRGFSRAARLVYNDVRPKLLPGYRLYITGHSLGGAEALIVGMLLKAEGKPPESLVTFGQPKVTNQAGVEAFKDLPLTRVINQADIIPELPIEPFRHIGPELVLFADTNYSVVERRPFNPEQLLAAWKALQNHQAPAQMPDHYIVNYLLDLNPKLTNSANIPYPQS